MFSGGSLVALNVHYFHRAALGESAGVVKQHERVKEPHLEAGHHGSEARTTIAA
jgi:hypothetical protein